MGNKLLDSFFKSFAQDEEKLDYRLAHETIGEKFPVISTGSLVLDDALSCGGLPKGRLIQFYGAPGSGKTLLSMIAILEAQKEDPDAQQVFIDAEQTFSSQWAENLGIDTSRIILIDGDTAVNGRKCFEMLLGVPKENKSTHKLEGKSKDGLLDLIRTKQININLMVLDSLGSIIPPSEDTSAIGKMNMSLLARFLTTTFRKLSLELSKVPVPFIIINHKRDNFDMYAASDHTFSGGNTYAHFLSANIYFEAVQRKDATLFDELEQKIGHTIRATIEKNKLGVWPRKCEFKVNFGVGIVDRHEEIANLAVAYEIIARPTSVAYEYNEHKWVGSPKYLEGIKEMPELAAELEVKIAEAREAKLQKKRTEQQLKTAEIQDKQAKKKEEENKKKEEKSKKKE